MKKLVAVTVPVYKQFDKLTDSEKISWKQSTNVFNQYDFVLVCPENLDVTGYAGKGQLIEIERFSEGCFVSIMAYNELLLSRDFFNRFSAYEYILLCQLDVFVFYDRLTEWCNRNYSFVGPPWFEGFVPEEDGAILWKVGNGGFSLRKVSDCLRVLHTFKFVFSWSTVLRNHFRDGFKTGIERLPFLIKQLLIGNNTYYKFNDYTSFEDVFWSVICQDRFKWYTIPTAKEALEFGFDYLPTVMLELTNGQLPMGFHGWDRHRNEFWKETFALNGFHV